MRAAPFNICIVGGGFTGAAVAVACCARLRQPFALTLIEPSPSLGRGVAYGSHHPLHLLNVRTRDLSIRADRPGDFLNWAFRQLDQGDNHAGLHEGLGHTFLPRQLFGEYVRQRFFEAVGQRSDVDFKGWRELLLPAPPSEAVTSSRSTPQGRSLLTSSCLPPPTACSVPRARAP